jgi:methylisocitrate lyase
MTEFGATSLFTLEELSAVGIRMVLYPLSAFRAMNKSAETVYRAIRRDGHQMNVIALMQTRQELYELLGYSEFERKLD